MAVNEAKTSQPFRTELAALLNRHSMENCSNTPDFILADYIAGCLLIFDRAVLDRERWYGHRHEPARADGPDVPLEPSQTENRA